MAESAAKLTVDDLGVVQEELYGARTHWYNMGLKLELKVDTLDTIDTKCSGDPSKCFRDMLKDHLKKTTPLPSWRSLAEALRSPIVNEPQLAEKVEQKYCVHTHPTDVQGTEDSSHYGSPHQTEHYDSLPQEMSTPPFSPGQLSAIEHPSSAFTSVSEPDSHPNPVPSLVSEPEPKSKAVVPVSSPSHDSKVFSCLNMGEMSEQKKESLRLSAVECPSSASTSVSEPNSCPNPVPFPVSEPEPRSKVVVSFPNQNKVHLFPYLNMGEMSEQEKEKLQCKLLKDTKVLMGKFGNVIHYTIISLNANSEVSVEILSSRLASLGAYKPIRAQKPLLRDDFEKICSSKTIDGLFCILEKYYTFFNYEIIQKIITWFGTPADMKRLQEYTTDFKQFCKRRTFECPPDIFGHPNEGRNTLVLKTERSWDPCEETQGKTLEQVLELKNSFGEILGVEPETLYLWRIDKGCMELLFQVPSFVEEDVFPLSVIQKTSLSSIGVARLTCGSGICMFSAKPPARPSHSKLDSLFSEEDEGGGEDDLLFLGGPSKKASTAKPKPQEAKASEVTIPFPSDPLSLGSPPQTQTKEVKRVITTSSTTDKENLFPGSQASLKQDTQPQKEESDLFSDPLLGGTPIIEAAPPSKPQARPKPKLKTKQDDRFGDSGLFAISEVEKKDDIVFLASGKGGPTEHPATKPKFSNNPDPSQNPWPRWVFQ